MIGLTGLVDTQLASKLSQRLDLVALKAEVQIAAPGPTIQAEKVLNNVGLFSRAALDRQILAGASAVPQPAVPHPAVAQLPAVELSVAARLINAVLTGIQVAAEPLRGTTPLWPLSSSSQAPLTAALAATLAQTVANSGLFYESHLLQLATGSRTLAQLTQEPQARWAPPMAATTAATMAATSDALPGPAEPLLRGALQQALQQALEAAPVQRAGNLAHPAGGIATPGEVSAPPVAEVIHPQAVVLLRQQLDLLASAVFRWSGEASPGVAMEWSIRKEQADQHADTLEEERPQRWATTLSLTLPRLGAVDIRLSLTGPIVQAHLAASEPATLARLQADAGELAQRLETAGLNLQALQVTALTRP